MTDEDARYRPFERCGYTVVYCRSVFQHDSPAVRITRGRWGCYLPVSMYDEFEGDDVAFANVMNELREDAERERDQIADAYEIPAGLREAWDQIKQEETTT